MRLIVDYVGRFEQIDKDFRNICNKIGVPYTKLPMTNKTTHTDYRKYYKDLCWRVF